MKNKLRDKYYEGLNKGDPMHWRNVGPDEIWDAAWQAAMTAMRKEYVQGSDGPVRTMELE